MPLRAVISLALRCLPASRCLCGAERAKSRRDGRKTMTEPTIRKPEEIRRQCATKLRSVQVSYRFQVMLGCLLAEDWTTPRLLEMAISPDGALLGRCEGQPKYSTLLGGSKHLDRNVQWVAAVAELDSDEIGFLLGKVAEIKALVFCPICRQALRLPTDKGDLAVRCPKCSHSWDWTASPPISQVAEEPAIQNPLVAVVDDDPNGRLISSKFIERLGWRVTAFESGEDFLANASRDIACVLMNEILVGLQGHQTFQQMRRDGWCIPVISECRWTPYEEILERYGHGQVAHVEGILDFTGLEHALRKGLRAAGYCLPPKTVKPFNNELLTWNNGTIPMLARSILQERAYHHLPVLGDALEEAGCMDIDLLNHCRQPGEHWRGCWVLDLLIGRSQEAPEIKNSGCCACCGSPTEARSRFCSLTCEVMYSAG